MQSTPLTREERAYAVERLPAARFLRDLADADIEALVDHCLIVRLPAGAAVFTQGDQPEAEPDMYIVLSGRVLLTRTVADQTERRIAVHGPLESFGELSAFDPGPRTTSAHCLVDTVLLTLSRRDALSWISTRPAAAEVVLRLLARRLRRTQDLWTDFVFVDLAARLARALLELAHTIGEPSDGGQGLDVVATQDELARRIGASRESVNRALLGLQQRGWIQRHHRTVTLLNTEALWLRAGAPSTLMPPDRPA